DLPQLPRPCRPPAVGRRGDRRRPRPDRRRLRKRRRGRGRLLRRGRLRRAGHPAVMDQERRVPRRVHGRHQRLLRGRRVRGREPRGRPVDRGGRARAGRGRRRAQRRGLRRHGGRQRGRAGEDHRDDVPEEPVHDPVAGRRREHRRTAGPGGQADRRPGLQHQPLPGAAGRQRHLAGRGDRRPGAVRPVGARQRRGRRLRRLPDQRIDHRRGRGPAGHEPALRRQRPAVRGRDLHRHRPDDRGGPRHAQGLPRGRDPRLDRRHRRPRGRSRRLHRRLRRGPGTEPGQRGRVRRDREQRPDHERGHRGERPVHHHRGAAVGDGGLPGRRRRRGGDRGPVRPLPARRGLRGEPRPHGLHGL
ncbi:MAG: Hydroxymethylpyrimidine ABC transporter, substrate-binding component, partial [uncultured Blastococcus sp.]